MDVRFTAKFTAGLSVVLLSAASAMAQSQSAPANSQSAPSWSPAQQIGMFAFPKNGQNADQQLKDESECYSMAKQRTGIDAQAPPPQGLSEEDKNLHSNRRLRMLPKLRAAELVEQRAEQQVGLQSVQSQATRAKGRWPALSPAR